MADQADIGVLGLAVMGANLARNAAHHGFGVAVFNRNHERTDELVAQHGKEGRFFPAKALPEFIASIAKPRPILIMVKAGKPVDEVIDELMPHLEENDIIIDGGNSLFTDTARRYQTCEEKKIRFVGMGVSGGEEGALKGPSMMPGGDREAWDRIAPMLTKMAAQVDGVPCCAYIGPQGAGHYVKMVHNGIEYADMQLIAEAYDLMKSVYGLDASAIADIFQTWKQGDLDSYLIEITAAVLRKTDSSGKPLVDVILDEAEQKGTGRWRPSPRSNSACRSPRLPKRSTRAAFRRNGRCGRRWTRRRRIRRISRVSPKRRRSTPSATRSTPPRSSPTPRASSRCQWPRSNSIGTSSSASWRQFGAGGCIIRARFLDRIKEAYDRNPKLSNLLLDDYFREGIVRTEGAWRRVLALAVENGVPTPAFSSALAYYDGLRRSRGPANLLQGLRDYFGVHTYRRLDRQGSFHTRWSQDGSEVKV